MSRSSLWLGFLSAVFVTVSCDKVPLLAPTESTVTLSINTTTLPINGTAELTATVIEQAGTPVHNGTVVSFTSSVGVVEPREAQTQGGVARATFRAGGQSGTALITAFSGAARSDEVEILVGGAAADRVTVRTEPSTVPTTGGTVQVIAVVVDASGNALPGAPVVFSSDAGSLSSNSALSDSNGEARTNLTTNRETIVRAAVAGKEAQTTVRAVNAPSVTITPSANPSVGVPVIFTIAASNGSSGNPITNVTMDFGDGSAPRALGPVPATGSIAVTHVYTRADTFTVKATARDSSGLEGVTSTVVTVLRATPQVTITSVSPPNPSAGQTVTATVSISNPQNITVQSVVISWGNGSQSALGSPQTGTASASTTYGSAGTYTIQATLTDVNGGVSKSSTTIVVQAGEAIEVDFSFVPQSLFSPATVFTVTLPATSAGISLYTWTYGDGVVQSTTSRTIEHRYTSPGTYQVTLRVTTTTGRTFDRTKSVVIP